MIGSVINFSADECIESGGGEMVRTELKLLLQEFKLHILLSL